MADTILSTALQVIFEKITSPVLETFGNIWDLKDNIQKLQSTLPMVQDLLEDAKGQQLTNSAARAWELKLKDVAWKAEYLLVDFSISDAISRTQSANQVRDILLALEKILDEGIRLNLGKGRAVQVEWNRRETSSFVVESEVYGREEDRVKVIELLLSSEASQVGKVSCVSLVGMGGVGKTTLAQLVYNDECIAQHYDVRVWVFVSQHFDAKSIMVTIIESLTKDKCNHLNMDSLHSEAWNLLRKKKYLIVLDDVWTEETSDWDALKPVFRGGIDGSKILITTRNRKVALMTDSPATLYNLNGLSEDACWSLFRQYAFQQGEEENHPALLPIGKQIVRKCGGLALAVKTLGSFMRFKLEYSAWLFVRDSPFWNFDECESGILRALRLSYFHLPPHLKRCFAFCSIFPRNYEIRKDKLVHLWVAEGLIRSTSGRPPEDIGSEYFKDLLWLSFFQEIKQSHNNIVTGYKLHDVTYDFMKSVTRLEYAFLDCRLSAPANLTQTRHLAIVCDFKSSTIPDELCEAKRLRTLFLFSEGTFGQIPSELFSSFKYLVALDLSGSGLENVGEWISYLSCLKFLDLSHTPVKRLSNTMQILPLQTLNLFNCCNLVALPNLARMRSLRHLNNIGCESLTSMFPLGRIEMDTTMTGQDELFSGQYELQTLPLFVIGGPFCIRFLGKLHLRGSLRITHLENVRNQTDAMSAELMKKNGIESLELYWGDDDYLPHKDPVEEFVKAILRKRKALELSRSSLGTDRDAPTPTPTPAPFGEEILKNLQPHENLKKLLIKGYPGIRFPRWSIPYLNAIDLIECRKAENLPVLGNLQFLNRLLLQAMHRIKRVGKELYSQGNERPFPALKELVLIDFPNLEEWSSPDCLDGFPSLSKLLLIKCPKLIVMPQVQSVQHLELRDCSSTLVHLFRNLTSLTRLVVEKIADLIYFSGAFPTNNALLMSLEIKSCPRLRSLPNELGNLTALKSLVIRWCPKLWSLPASLQDLNALESLEIGDCNNLRSLPEDTSRGLRNLQTLSIENCNDLDSLSVGFQNLTSLENLTIMYCPNIFALPQSIEYAQALRSLTILSCLELWDLSDGLQTLKALHSLEIRNCPGLRVLPEWIENLVSLRSLAISQCHNIRFLPQGLRSLTLLQHLSIQDCRNLLRRCAEPNGEDWPKICHVPYKHIGSADRGRPSESSNTASSR